MNTIELTPNEVTTLDESEILISSSNSDSFGRGTDQGDDDNADQ